MKIPKISVIVPIWNVEKYFDRCMQSLINQTLFDIEFILVDDESPDNCPNMCDEYAKHDARIKVIHKKNEGLGLARNSGLEVATGEYVAFVDSDDFLDVRMYETLYNIALQNNSDAVYCNSNRFYNESKIEVRKDVEVQEQYRTREEVDGFLMNLIGPLPERKHDAMYTVSVWHAIYKRELFNKYNILFVSERQIISEDVIFDIDFLSKAEKIVYIPDALYYYCVNNDSLSQKNRSDRYDKVKYFLNEVNRRLADLYPVDYYIMHYFRQQFICMRIMMKWAVKCPQSGLTLQHILNDIYWKNLLNNYPYWRMDFKHRLFFYCMKKRKYIGLQIALRYFI